IKNHFLIINSMSKLCTTFPNLHLAIIGDGELRTELESLIKKLNLTNKIHFFGIIKDLEDIYSDLDLLILCSKNEGTPVVLIEALASGCPVASTNVGGVSEVLENGKLGRLLSSEPDIFTQGLYKAISDLLKNRFAEYPTDEIRKKISDYYSVNNLVSNIKKLYKDNFAD
ncbi:MAG: glycosyltransferase, partial [Candidatus Riflebacteria bacterium]|nr:glycosyltransferase [Candidatus Riflebacteria bacterium]